MSQKYLIFRRSLYFSGTTAGAIPSTSATINLEGTVSSVVVGVVVVVTSVVVWS